MTVTILDNEIFRPLPAKFGTEMWRCEVGSGAYGVTTGGDDRDEMGVCVEPAEYVIGLRRFEQWTYRTQPEGARSGGGDLDLTVYSLRKWARLAAAGNPTVLMLLFAPPADAVVTSGWGLELLDRRDLFLSRQVAARFLGYMAGQRAQLTGERPRKHTNRPELVARFGFDTKFAYHMLRLGFQGCELLETGSVSLPIPEPERSFYRSVRMGDVPLPDVLATGDRYEVRLRAAEMRSPLPERSDPAALDGWLVQMYRRVWAVKGASR